MPAKRPILDPMRQRQKAHYCPDCEMPVKLFKQGGKMRGRCGKGHEYPKAALVLR